MNLMERLIFLFAFILSFPFSLQVKEPFECGNVCQNKIRVKVVKVDAKPCLPPASKPIMIKSRVVVTKPIETVTKPVCAISTQHATVKVTMTNIRCATSTVSHCCIEKIKKEVTKTSLIVETSTVIKPVAITKWATCWETLLISTIKSMECVKPTTQVTIVMETATVQC